MAGQVTYTKEDVLFNKCDWKPNKKFKDLQGKQFGDLKVLKLHKREKPHTYWFVECSCGVIISQSTNCLNRGRSSCKSCSFKKMGENKLIPEDDSVSLVLNLHKNLTFISSCNRSGTKSEWLWYCSTCNTPFYHSVDRLKSHEGFLCRCNPTKFSRWTEQLRNHQIKHIAYERGLLFLGWRDTFVSSTSRFFLKCKKHKHYESNVANFTNNTASYGCPYCAEEKKGETYKHDKDKIAVEGEKVHGLGTYDFSDFEYKDSRTSGKIICNSCNNPFYNSYDNVVNKGQGCRCKANYGYNSSISGKLYLHKLDNFAIKYGITNHDPYGRMRIQSNSGNYDHEMLYVFESDNGRLILDCETYIKRNIQKNFITKDNLGQGFSETMCISNLDVAYKYLESKLGNPIFTKGGD